MTAHCVQCGTKFVQKSSSQEFCRVECRKAWDKAERDFKYNQRPAFSIRKPTAPGGQVINFGDSAEF